VVKTQHHEDIHSRILTGPFSDAEGKQNIIAFQKRFLYSLDLLSIHQCKIILFFDVF
jgi:hypothetical protein